MTGGEQKEPTSILEAMVDHVYVVDHDFNLLYMNDVMIKTFGQGGVCRENHSLGALRFWFESNMRSC
jgi:hypothetical protein